MIKYSEDIRCGSGRQEFYRLRGQFNISRAGVLKISDSGEGKYGRSVSYYLTASLLE